jgi:hypothetical protein
MANNANLSDTAFCQFWYDSNDDPLITKVFEKIPLWPSYWGTNENGFSPYLISCENPLKRIPKFVSIVEDRCDDAFNLLQVCYKPKSEKLKNFVVCVKNMNFKNDISSNLIEWLEILKIFKVDRVIVYVTEVHEEVMKVLTFYQSQGLLHVNYMKYPELIDESPLQVLQNEMIPYQDCFYKSYNEFNYVVPIDIDEFIIPLKPEDRTWIDLMRRILSKKTENSLYDSYEARNIHFYYVDDYLKKIHPERKVYHFLDNTLRNPQHFDVRFGTKSFISTKRTLIVHNHYPLKCLKKSQECNDYQIELEDGQLNHYRKTCTGDLDSEDCKKEEIDKAVNDTILWKYADELKKNVENTLKNFKDYKN